MKSKVILVPPSDETGKLAQEMAPSGIELVLARGEGIEREAALADARYMVCYPNVRMDDAFYKAAPKLRLMQLLSAGYDDVDIEAARRAKVPVCNNGGANAISVSEHAIMLMLAVSRRVIWQHATCRPAAGAATGRRRDVRALRQDARHRRPRHHRQEGGAASAAPSACGSSTTTSRG